MNRTLSVLRFNRSAGGHAGDRTDVSSRSRCPPSPTLFPYTTLFRSQLPPGDPDFDLLRITAGNGFGMPSPGHTTHALPSNRQSNVDCFFGIPYRIDFVGHLGGPLRGMSGSTTGTIRMATGQSLPPPP